VLTIKHSTHFDPVKIANSGQVFRADIKDDGVHFISADNYAVIVNEKIYSTNDDYFYNYFDFDTDYGKIESALKMGQGLRILYADFVETVISFIISANNNIKRIKKTVAGLCEKYGKPRKFGEIIYRAFPTLEMLKTITADEWHKLGCGYRSPYLVKAVIELSIMDFNELNKLDNDKLYKQIIRLHGVGDKVARCIMLFAFHRMDIVPVDTRIMQRARQFIDTKNKTAKTVAEALQRYFGKYAGVAQQYIFDKTE
jgi:N-glycosylase/DNA lyase